MWGRNVTRLIAVAIVIAFLCTGISVSGKQKSDIRLPVPGLVPGVVKDLLATPHQPTVNDIQLEWSEVPGAIGYNVYRSNSVRGSGFNFSAPYTNVPGDGIGKIIWVDSGAYADASNHSWVVRFITGTGENQTSSNPAWKLVYRLFIGTGLYGRDQNYISLPYQVNISSGSNVNNAVALLADIRTYGSPANAVSSVGRWNSDVGIWETRISFAGKNFALTPGEGYRVVAGQNTTYKIVGSYNPDFVHTLKIGTGPATPDLNYISIPYHFNIISGSYINDAVALRLDIRASGIPTNGVTSVQRWNSNTAIWEVRTVVGTNFLLKPGECYRIGVSSIMVTWICPVAGV